MQHIVQQFEKIYAYTWGHDEHIHVRTYEKGVSFIQIGDAMDGFYFLISGTYYVTSPESNGKELLLRRCVAPSIIGDVEIFQRCDVQSNCVAMERCTFLFVPRALYEQHLQYDAAFTALLLQELAFKLRTCTLLSRVNALSSVHVKLAAYLCTVHTEGRDHYLVVQHMRDIAPLLGTTNRHINRILKKWEEEHILTRNADDIVIMNMDQLIELADGVRYA